MKGGRSADKRSAMFPIQWQWFKANGTGAWKTQTLPSGRQRTAVSVFHFQSVPAGPALGLAQ